MAEQVLHGLEVGAGFVGQGRGAVAEVVEADGWEVGTAGEDPEASGPAALAEGYGQAVAISFVCRVGQQYPGRRSANDNGNVEGGSDIRTNVGGCASGFPFVAGSQEYMVTAQRRQRDELRARQTGAGPTETSRRFRIPPE